MNGTVFGFWSRVIDGLRWLAGEAETQWIRVQNALLYPVRWAETVLHRSFGVPMDCAGLVLAALAGLICTLTAAAVLLAVRLRGRK